MEPSDALCIRQAAPNCLRDLPQWVCWRVEDRDGKSTKVPIIPGTTQRASSTDTTQWRTFDEAMGAFEAAPSLVGIGFVFSADGPYCGVDIDDCRDADTDHIAPWAQSIIDSLDSYTEVSPSGTGVKIFMRASKPGRKCRKAHESGEVEIYDQGRFFTVTGAHVAGTPPTVEDRQDALGALYASIFGTDEQESVAPGEPTDVNLSDDEIVKLVSSGRKNNEKFAALWAGRWNDYFNTPSEADSSLVFKLAYYTKDAAQIDRLFRQSGLYRDKWDELRGEQSYGQITINRALAKVTKQYRPRKRARRPSRNQVAAGGNQAPRPGTRDSDSGRLILSTERTLPTAESFVSQFCMHDDGPTLNHYANIFFEWRDNRYAEVEDSTLKHRLLPWLNEALCAHYDAYENAWTFSDFPANPRTVNAALDSLRAHTHLPATLRPPLWLHEGEECPSPREILACRSSLLHLPTMRHMEPTPTFLSFNALDYDPDPEAAEPELWFHFLDQVFGDDEEAKELLQDWFGYCLTGDTSQQKMLLMVGPKRSGKGTIARVLSRLVGPGNVCGPTTSSLAGDFGLQPLVGKNLAIVSDARFSGDRVQTVVERLLCISGEDLLTVDRKHLPSVHMQLPTRFVFLTNEIPRLCDASGALAGRFMVLKFTESFYGREDKALTKKLTGELPGILNWAIEGWKRLQERGRFLQPESVESVMEDMEHLSSPVSAFVQQCCDVAPELRCPINEMYDAYLLWSAWEGFDLKPTKQTFGRNLQAAVPGLKIKRNHTEGRFYEGIVLTPGCLELIRPNGGSGNRGYAQRNDETHGSDPWEDLGNRR
jgi:putative DNA primase/helicase